MNAVNFLLNIVMVGGSVAFFVWMLVSAVQPAASYLSWFFPMLAVIAALGFASHRLAAGQLNQLGNIPVVWRSFQTLLAVGYMVGFVVLERYLQTNWTPRLFDLSPRGMFLISVVMTGLVLSPTPPLIGWIIPTTGAFARATYRIIFGCAFLVALASMFHPKDFFDPHTGAPLAKTDSEGNFYRDMDKKFSPATGEELKVITPAEAKKQEPFGEKVRDFLSDIGKDLEFRRSASSDGAPMASASSPSPCNLRFSSTYTDMSETFRTLVEDQGCKQVRVKFAGTGFRNFYLNFERGVVCATGVVPVFNTPMGVLEASLVQEARLAKISRGFKTPSNFNPTRSFFIMGSPGAEFSIACK